MGKKSAPAAPNPRETAAAATGTNIGTAIANSQLNNADQVGPDGSIKYSQSGTYNWTDPYTGKTYAIPKTTATTTLSPEQQAIKAQTDGAELNLGTLANQQSGFLKDYMAKPFSLDNDAVEGRLMDLGMKRLQPALDARRASQESDLINRGIRPGSSNYGQAQDTLNQGENDAFNSLLLSGRQQSVSEALAARNQPINEITALLSGSQVSNPQAANFNQSPIATTDVGGLIGQNYQQQLAAWQQKQQAGNGVVGGLFGLGSAAIMASDRRVKKDIRRIGKTDDGQNLYFFRYKGTDKPQIGLMADEVEKVHPGAVMEINGVKHVDYARAV